MGGSPSKPDVEFVRTLDDSHFGRVQLHRRNDIEYIMKKTFTFVHRDNAAERLLRNLDFMEKNKHESLPPVHHLNRCKEQQLCIEYERVELYIDYYNYTFEAVVESQKALELGELWYALATLTDLGGMLFKEQLNCCLFRLDSVFVSLKGAPCVYLMDGWALEQATEDQTVKALALVMLSLATIRRLGEQQSYETELATVAVRSDHLAKLLRRMLTQPITFEEVSNTIDRLVEGKEIKIANSLKLSKFKALIPMARLSNVMSCKSTPTQSDAPSVSSSSTVPVEPQKPKQQRVSQPIQPRASHYPPLESLKLLEMRKSENQQQQKRMKQRMEQLLGKQNLSIGVNTLSINLNLNSTANRSVNRSVAESGHKPSMPSRTLTTRNSTSRRIKLQK